jgi:Family of unknown function (DUF5723)
MLKVFVNRLRFPNTVTILFLCASSIQAQEQMGLRTERHSGVYSTAVNPSGLAFSPQRWDLSLFNADLFFNQHYAFLPNSSVAEALRNADKIVVPESGQEPPRVGEIQLGFVDRGRPFQVFQTRLNGPSFSFQVGDQHHFALGAGLRVHQSVYRLPAITRYSSISTLEQGETYTFGKARFSAAAWAEVAATYAYSDFSGDLGWSFGVSPKLLLGLQGGFAHSRDAFDFTQISSDSIRFSGGNWAYGFTNDIAYSNDPATARLRTNGIGMGVDIGASWALMADDKDNPTAYLWRAGVSLLDLGALRFTDHAEQHRIQFDTTLTATGRQIEDGANNSPASAVRAISTTFLRDSLQSRTGDRFAMGLPTAISAQFDLRLARGFYLGALITQRIPMGARSLRRPNTLALTPRYERQWFMLALPVVVSDYRSLRLGAAVRLGYLYLGSDDVFSLIGKPNLTGTDFYVGLKFNPFDVNWGGNKGNRGGGSGKIRKKDRHWRGNPCYPM